MLLTIKQLLQVGAFLAQRARSKGKPSSGTERLQLANVRKTLQQALREKHANAAAVFLQGLLGILDACAVVSGRASPSRKTVRAILVHFARHELPKLVLAQQRLVRRLFGGILSLDGTFSVASSLVGADHSALSKSGKPKAKSYSAVCLTICVEHGLAVAAPIVPDEQQIWSQVALLGLAHAQLHEHASRGERLIYNITAFGGPLRMFPRLLISDNIGKDINLWSRVARAYVIGCLEHDVPIMIPEGVPDLYNC